MIFYACIGLNMHLGSNSFWVDISWYFIHVSDWICIFKFKCIWSWYTLTSNMHRSDLNLCKRRKVYIEAYIYLTWYMQWIKYALDFKYIEVDMYWIYKKSGWIKFQNNKCPEKLRGYSPTKEKKETQGTKEKKRKGLLESSGSSGSSR